MAEKKPEPLKPPDQKAEGWKNIQDEHADRLQQGFPWSLDGDFTVEANFVHFLKPMMSEGFVAKMGPKAFTVLMAIKTFTDMETGDAFPSRATLSKCTGLGLAAIDNAIKRLLEMGLLVKKETAVRRRVPTYNVVEPIPVKGEKGEVIAMAMKEYKSKDFNVREIKDAISQALRSGSDAGLEGVTVNVNLSFQIVEVNQNGDNAVFTNVGQALPGSDASVGKSGPTALVAGAPAAVLPPGPSRRGRDLKGTW